MKPCNATSAQHQHYFLTTYPTEVSLPVDPFFFNPDLLYYNLANHVLVLEKNTGDVTLLTLQCCLFDNHTVLPCKLYTHFRI